jgi:hypothetical protein
VLVPSCGGEVVVFRLHVAVLGAMTGIWEFGVEGEENLATHVVTDHRIAHMPAAGSPRQPSAAPSEGNPNTCAVT